MKAKTGKIWFSDLLTATIVRKTTNRTLGKMHPIRFCARLAHFAEGKPSLRQAAPRQNASKLAFALSLHYLWLMAES
mgnify:CR=1 FL=1